MKPECAIIAAIVGGCAGTSGAQVLVENASMTQSDLDAGVYDGQPFTIDPGLTIDVGQDGLFGPVGSNNGLVINGYNFGQSTVRINDGGRFVGDSYIRNLTLDVNPGGVVDRLYPQSGNTINVNGGTISTYMFARGAGNVINVNDGSITGEIDVWHGGHMNLAGGSISRQTRISLGSTMTITGGAAGDTLNATSGATIDIYGGAIGKFMYASGSPLGPGAGTINIYGGTVDRNMNASGGGVINVYGGTVGLRASSAGGGTVNIYGGDVGIEFRAQGGSVTNISGGTVGELFQAQNNSTVNISGGTIGDSFLAYPGSLINLEVLGLSIDGVPVPLSMGTPTEITQRGGALLQATLADGSLLDFTLGTTGGDYFPSDATLTAVLTVPAPGAGGCLVFGLLMSRRRRR